MATSIDQEKAQLRQAMLARRAALGQPARVQANQLICQSLIALPEYQKADTIFSYVSVSDEPDTIALIEASWLQGKRVCVPRCLALGVMQAFAISSWEDLQQGRYDIPEPVDGCTEVLPEAIDLIIVPCVCCSQDGFRLGYGGGFYDRWLQQAAAPAVLLCYSELVVPAVPLEPHDQRIDILISAGNTAAAVRRFS